MFNQDFGPCCGNHDACYGACGVDKGGCDQNFFLCLLDTCAGLYPGKFNRYTLNYERCIQSAELYYRGVKNYGFDAFCSAQSANCTCGTPTPPAAPAAPAPPAPPPRKPPREAPIGPGKGNRPLY
jgi:hypothetical protein